MCRVTGSSVAIFPVPEILSEEGHDLGFTLHAFAGPCFGAAEVRPKKGGETTETASLSLT